MEKTSDFVFLIGNYQLIVNITFSNSVSYYTWMKTPHQNNLDSLWCPSRSNEAKTTRRYECSPAATNEPPIWKRQRWRNTQTHNFCSNFNSLTESALPAVTELNIKFGDNAAKYTMNAVTAEEQAVSTASTGILRTLTKNGRNDDNGETTLDRVTAKWYVAWNL